jgi:hypothetical protein
MYHLKGNEMWWEVKEVNPKCCDLEMHKTNYSAKEGTKYMYLLGTLYLGT